MPNYYLPEELQQLRLKLAVIEGRGSALSEAIGTARDAGDLKENSEYQERKNDQGKDDAFKNVMQGKINTSINERDPNNSLLKELGTMLILEDLDGNITKKTLSGEFFATENFETSDGIYLGSDYYMNVNSPIGKMYFDAKKGTEILQSIKGGFDVFTIVDIKPNTDALLESLNKKDKKAVEKFRKSLLNDDQYGALVDKKVKEASDEIASKIKKILKKTNPRRRSTRRK